MKADRVLAGADIDRRREYELRARRSEPGLEPAPKQPQIAQVTQAAPPAEQAGQPSRESEQQESETPLTQ